MSFGQIVPIHISEPDPLSRAVADRLHWAICRGKFSTASKILINGGVSVELTNRAGQTPLFCAAFFGHSDLARLLIKLGADPNRRCSIDCCTPVHAACWSGNRTIITSLLIAGGDLRLHDRQNRSPRDWANMQPNNEAKLATLALIESFRQIAMKGSHDLNSSYSSFVTNDSGIDGNGLHAHQQHHTAFRLPAKLRNSLANIGLVCNENCDYVGPYGNVQGTGFGKTIYGHGESAAALWPVPLVNESEIIDPDAEGCGVEADLNGLLPRGVNYRSGPTTEMVGRLWGPTPVTIRRMRDNEPPDLLLEELDSMRRLRHPGLMLLMGVSMTQHLESVQLIYEPIYHGSLHHRIHIMGSSIPQLKRLRILQQICEALLFLHSKQLLHCSISSHAVHLISSSRAKLGCLETLTEIDSLNPHSRRMYRKVPPKHWEWMTPWMSPEASRGESLCPQSDVYSFCCLVWETCCEKQPRFHMDPREIELMWQRQAATRGVSGSSRSQDPDLMLPLDSPSIPLHINSFLKLGLQPELKDRRDIDLQEIFLMLRLQAAAIFQSQQKMEVQQVPKKVQQQKPPRSIEMEKTDPSTIPTAPRSTTKSKTPLPKNPHAWDAVKEQLKSSNSFRSAGTQFSPPPSHPPPPPPPLPSAHLMAQQKRSSHLQPPNVLPPVPELSISQHPLDQVVDEEDDTTVETEQLSPNENIPLEVQQPDENIVNTRRIRFESDTTTTLSPRDNHTTPPQNVDYSRPMLPKGCRSPQCSEFAIKPASHTTERHSSNCLLVANNNVSNNQPNQSERSCYHTPNGGSNPEKEMVLPNKPTRILNAFQSFEVDIEEDHDEGNLDEEDEESGITSEVSGQPSSTSTPRHNLVNPGKADATFLACSSTLEDADQRDPGPNQPSTRPPSGSKPKRSLPFKANTSPARHPSFLTNSKPSRDVVESLKAKFQNPLGMFRSNNNHENGSRQRLMEPEECVNIGDTFNEEDCVSRGVQCDPFTY